MIVRETVLRCDQSVKGRVNWCMGFGDGNGRQSSKWGL